VTIINLCIGVIVALICALSGMPNPIGLGALATALNFIPILGPIATFVVLLAVGLISFSDFIVGLLPAALFAVVAFLEGHFITPAIIGRQLELNALAVFLSLAFWTWLWGPIGALLSSPLLITMLTIAKGNRRPRNGTCRRSIR
jgi:predicted PurR-regulated permease PerM